MNDDDGLPPADDAVFDLPVFDEKTTRRTVRRATRRTAFLAALTILVAVLAVRGASLAWNRRSADRFELVMARAYEIANPGYLVFVHNSDARFDFGSELVGTAQAWQPDGFSTSGTQFHIRRNVFGRVTTTTFLPPTRLDNPLHDLRNNRDPSAVEDLPRATVMRALIELKAPMDETAFTRFRRGLRVCALNRQDSSDFGSLTHEEFQARQSALARYESDEAKICGSNPSSGRTGVLVSMMVSPSPHYSHFVEKSSGDGSHRITWPWPTLDRFKDWATQLRASDEPNLKALLLPDVDEFKRRAADGKIYGFIVTRLRPEVLQQLLARPEVGEIYIGEVGLDLG
jgi:hypothetical protein